MRRLCTSAALVVGIGSILLVWRRPASPESGPPVAEAVDIRTPTPGALTSSPLQERFALMRPTHAPAVTNGTSSAATNLLAWLIKADGKPPHITGAQAEAFAAANGRRADALLAAWRASGDNAFLREAMEKFPNDPHVTYMAWCKGGAEESPEAAAKATLEWMGRFKQAAPDNAIADYISARAHLKAGDVDAALSEISAARQKPWRDYTLDEMQNTEEAYRSAGFSEAEAKAIAAMGTLLPHVRELRGLGQSLSDLATARRQAGDSASADATVQWALQLGERTGQDGTATLLQQFVAVGMQKDALKGMDPNATVGGSSLTVQQRLAMLDQQRDTIRSVARDSADLMPRLSESELSSYFDRLKFFGEAAAVQWAKSRVEQPAAGNAR